MHWLITSMLKNPFLIWGGVAAIVFFVFAVIRRVILDRSFKKKKEVK